VTSRPNAGLTPGPAGCVELRLHPASGLSVQINARFLLTLDSRNRTAALVSCLLNHPEQRLSRLEASEFHHRRLAGPL
jgi:hypothetical protein